MSDNQTLGDLLARLRELETRVADLERNARFYNGFYPRKALQAIGVSVSQPQDSAPLRK